MESKYKEEKKVNNENVRERVRERGGGETNTICYAKRIII